MWTHSSRTEWTPIEVDSIMRALTDLLVSAGFRGDSVGDSDYSVGTSVHSPCTGHTTWLRLMLNHTLRTHASVRASNARAHTTCECFRPDDDTARSITLLPFFPWSSATPVRCDCHLNNFEGETGAQPQRISKGHTGECF